MDTAQCQKKYMTETDLQSSPMIARSKQLWIFPGGSDFLESLFGGELVWWRTCLLKNLLGEELAW